MRKRSFLRAAITVLVLAASLSSCAESRFDLAPDSRLPSWFVLPQGTARSQVSVELAYYVMPLGRSATLTLFDASGRKVKTISATSPGLYPVKLDEDARRPVYEVAMAEGITEVIEHRESGPTFHLVDDPSVRELVLGRVSPRR